MKKSALKALVRDPGGWTLTGLCSIYPAFAWIYLPASTALFWTLIYGAINAFIGGMFYRTKLDRLRHAAEQDERQAQWDAEDERREVENQILDEDHERRMLEVEVTGKDPGPSGRAARIHAERQARLAGHIAKNRMERKARIAARQATDGESAEQAA